MSSIYGQHKELLTLLEELCEDRITVEGANRLEKIVLGDAKNPFGIRVGGDAGVFMISIRFSGLSGKGHIKLRITKKTVG